MIKSITVTKKGYQLVVDVECALREFAIHPIKVLTTEQVIDKISDNYNVLSVVESPKSSVGNTKRRKMTNSGTWVFEIQEKEEESFEQPPVEPEPEPEPEPEAKSKQKPKPKTTSRTSRTKRSVRGRLTSIAKSNKKD